MVEAIDRLTEAGAGFAADGVTAPAEVTEFDFFVGKCGNEQRLEVALLLIPFDERVADEGDARMIGKREWPLLGKCPASRQNQAEREEERSHTGYSNAADGRCQSALGCRFRRA